MRLAYLDTFAGLSGDMFVAALIDAGAPVELLRDNLERLDLGARLEIRKVNRSGIQAVKADVMVGTVLAESTVEVETHAHHHGHEHGHGSHHEISRGHQPATTHRSYSSIRTLILESELPTPVVALALRTFEELARAESKIHGISMDAVHFHEVGAVDAIADIVLGATAIHALQIDSWHCSPLNVGGGTVECAHGRFPVPAPATAELLRGAPTYSSGIQMECVTPTGAAFIRALRCKFGPSPAMCVDQIGYGAGSRNPENFANVLRVSIGAGEDAASTDGDVVTVIETAVDDLNPQIIAYVIDKALQMGALDVMCQPV